MERLNFEVHIQLHKMSALEGNCGGCVNRYVKPQRIVLQHRFHGQSQCNQKVKGFLVPQRFREIKDVLGRTIKGQVVGLVNEFKEGVLGKKCLDEIFVNHRNYPRLCA